MVVIYIGLLAYLLLVKEKTKLESLKDSCLQSYRRLVSLVGKIPVYRAGGLGSILGRTNTQVLPLGHLG